MISLFTFLTPPHDCAYRPGETARMQYDIAGSLTPAEYEGLMLDGWRRFGHSLFKHACPNCSACQSIRVPIATFHPNRSQRRSVQKNADVELTITKPSVTMEKLQLYDRFHEAQSDRIGWPDHGAKDPQSYSESFVMQPFAVEEWQYRLRGHLVGVGYVDPLPHSLSAIYFFHDPNVRERSLGTFNVMSVLESARQRGLEFVYLGYFVEGCRSLEYKARFTPNEVRDPIGNWVHYR